MKYFLGISVIVNILLLVTVGTGAYFFTTGKLAFVAPQTAMQNQTPKTSSITLNKTFTLPIATGSAQTPLTLTITSIDKTTKINIGDRSYTTKNNKAFLVVNTKMVNTGTKPFSLSASEFVSLSQQNALVAPLYKALQTKLAVNGSYESGMVFIVDESQSAFTLTIGQNVNAVSVLPISL